MHGQQKTNIKFPSPTAKERAQLGLPIPIKKEKNSLNQRKIGIPNTEAAQKK